ncbi:MAG: ExbD/TolR family protein, partial [Desulforhopalus sp.]
QEDEPIVITVSKEGEISINSVPLVRSVLIQELQKNYAANKEQPVFLKADKNVPYGHVVTVMADIKSVGFDKIGMITKPPENE